MPEIIWKQGAENDLLQIFSNLEDCSEGTGERLVRKLDGTLENLKIHPGIAPPFEGPVRRLVIGSVAMACFIPLKPVGSSFMR